MVSDSWASESLPPPQPASTFQHVLCCSLDCIIIVFFPAAAAASAPQVLDSHGTLQGGCPALAAAPGGRRSRERRVNADGVLRSGRVLLLNL